MSRWKDVSPYPQFFPKYIDTERQALRETNLGEIQYLFLTNTVSAVFIL